MVIMYAQEQLCQIFSAIHNGQYDSIKSIERNMVICFGKKFTEYSLKDEEDSEEESDSSEETDSDSDDDDDDDEEEDEDEEAYDDDVIIEDDGSWVEEERQSGDGEVCRHLVVK